MNDYDDDPLDTSELEGEDSKETPTPPVPAKKKRGVLGTLGDILTGKPGVFYTEQTVGGVPQSDANGKAITGPDGKPQMVGQTVQRTPTTAGRIVGGLANILQGAAAGAAAPSSPNAGQNIFSGMNAGFRANQAQGELQNRLNQEALQNQIQSFEMNRQIGMDKRAQEQRDETNRHNQAIEDRNTEVDKIREQNNADTAAVNATKDGRYSLAAPDLSDYLEASKGGRLTIDSPELADFKAKHAQFAPPENFDPSQYGKIGGRWLQAQAKTPKDLARDQDNVRKAAAAGMKYVDDDGKPTNDPTTGHLAPMTDQERSAIQNSLINKNNSTADLAGKRASYMDRSLDIRNRLAGIALMNAQTNSARLALAKDRFGLDYTGKTDDGRIILTDPSTGQVIVPKMASMQKVPAAQARKVADAEVMDSAGDDLTGMIDDLAKENKIGPIAGRVEMGKERLGIADPDVKALVVGLKHYADQLPDTYGARGAQMAARFEESIKNIDQDPESVKAAIKEIQKYGGFIKKANQRTYLNPSGVPQAAAPAPAQQKQATGQPSTKVVNGIESYMMTSPDGKTRAVKKQFADKMSKQGWKYVN